MVCALILCLKSFILKPVTGNFTRLSLARAHSALLPTLHRGTSFGTKSAKTWTNKTKTSVSREAALFFLFMLLFTQLLLWPASCCPFPAQSSRSWAGPTGPNRVRKCPKSYTCLSLRREVWPPVQFRSRLVWLGGSSVYFAFNPSAFHLGRVLVSLPLKFVTKSSANKSVCWFYDSV